MHSHRLKSGSDICAMFCKCCIFIIILPNDLLDVDMVSKCVTTGTDIIVFLCYSWRKACTTSWELQGKKLNRTEQFHEVSVTVFPDKFFYRIKLPVQSLFNISSRWVRVYLHGQRYFGAEKKILVSKKRYQGERVKFCKRFSDRQ